MHTWCPGEQEEAIKSPGTGVRIAMNYHVSVGEPNPGPLQEQRALSSTKSSLQPCLLVC